MQDKTIPDINDSPVTITLGEWRATFEARLAEARQVGRLVGVIESYLAGVSTREDLRAEVDLANAHTAAELAAAS